MKTEVGKEVAAARRKQHLSSLQYYCALNALQYRKRMAMMEPMIGFAHGQVGLLLWERTSASGHVLPRERFGETEALSWRKTLGLLGNHLLFGTWAG